MFPSPFGLDVMWECDPLPVPLPPRPVNGLPDAWWHRAQSAALLAAREAERHV